MGHLEEYLNQTEDERRVTATRMGGDKTLKIDGPEFHYDMKHLEEHYASKFADDSEEAFLKRTRYYFQDTFRAGKKVNRYQNLSNKREPAIVAYARRYGNRGADKRASRAQDASRLFLQMRNTMIQIKRQGEDNLNSVQKYENREKVMKLRQQAMEKAAITKGRSEKHENHLVGRARLSCNMVLKDQLRHLIAGETDQELLRQLHRKLDDVNDAINAAKELLRNNTPEPLDDWRAKNGLNSNGYKAKYNTYKRSYRRMNKHGAKLLADFDLLGEQNLNAIWYKELYLEDSEGNAINKVEREKENRYLQANELDGLARFLAYQLPSLDELRQKGVYTMLRENAASWYEMTVLILPNLAEELNDPGRYLSHHVRNEPGLEPKLRAKIRYMQTYKTYVDYVLRREYGIEFATDKYQVESEEAVKNSRNGFGNNAQQAALWNELVLRHEVLRTAWNAQVQAPNPQIQQNQPHVQENQQQEENLIDRNAPGILLQNGENEVEVHQPEIGENQEKEENEIKEENGNEEEKEVEKEQEDGPWETMANDFDDYTGRFPLLYRIPSLIDTAEKAGEVAEHSAIKHRENATLERSFAPLLVMDKKENEKWLDLWDANKTEEREAYIREKLPLIFQNVVLPSAEALRDPQWLVNAAEDNTLWPLLRAVRQVRGMKALLLESPAARQCMKENRELAQTVKKLLVFNQFVTELLLVETGIELRADCLFGVESDKDKAESRAERAAVLDRLEKLQNGEEVPDEAYDIHLEEVMDTLNKEKEEEEKEKEREKEEEEEKKWNEISELQFTHFALFTKWVIYPDVVDLRRKTGKLSKQLKDPNHANENGAFFPLLTMDEQQNERWLSLWEEGRAHEREEYIEKNLPHIFDDVKLPLAKDLRDPGWILDAIKKKTLWPLLHATRQVRGLDALAQESPAAAKCMADPAFAKTLAQFRLFERFVTELLKVEIGWIYGFDASLDNTEKDKQESRKQREELLNQLEELQRV